MAYCVIIRGPLGVGKTTIARKLAKALHGKYISIDSLLEKQGLDKVDKTLNRILLANFVKAADPAIPELKSAVKKGRVIVFDGNFYHKKQIDHLRKSLGCRFHIFTLKAPFEVCIKRDSGRKKPYGRKAAKEVFDLVSKFASGMSINTKNKTPAEVTKEVLQNL